MSGRAVVVGGGVSGMATALLLARFGRRVTLVESSARLAPLLRGFRHDGVRYETGFHYAGGLGPGGPFRRLLVFLGLELPQVLPLRREGYDRCLAADGRFDFSFPQGEEALGRSLAATFPGCREAVSAYLAALRQARNTFAYMADDPAQGTPFGEVGDRTLGQVLDRLTDDEGLKRVLCCHTFLHGSPADEVPFAIHACVAGPYYDLAATFAGGGEVLAEAFEAALARLGVEVIRARRVEAILAGAGGACAGVTLPGGEVIGAENVVAAIHPRGLLGLAPPGAFSPAFRHRIESLGETFHADVLFAVRAASPEPDPPGNIFRLTAPFRRSFGQASPPAARPLYVSFGETAPDGRLGAVAISPTGPDETAPWIASRHGRRPAAYDRYKAERTETLLASVGELLPGGRGSLQAASLSTPLTFHDLAGHPTGSLYGVKRSVDQLNPGPRTRLRGLFLAGAATATPGVLGATVSGFMTAGEIVGHDTLRRELRRCA
jgi:all-trans-retinol 13,14-reductase